MAISTSENAAEDAYTRSVFGPHTFHFQLFGSTRTAQEPGIYEGDCRYRFDFDAKDGGRLGMMLYKVWEVRKPHAVQSKLLISFL